MEIKKRDGFLEDFQKDKIKNAVLKALEETKENTEFADEIAGSVESTCETMNKTGEEITVEKVQDMIEDELINRNLIITAKAFIKYRQQRTDIRNKGWQMDDLQQAIWEKKYRFNNESFDEWLDRVSGKDPALRKLISQKKFIFAGRILAHRGLQRQGKKVTYSNCYVIPQPEDNLESIFDTAKLLARTYSYGGGCGVDISKLRPKGALVNNSAKITSGATSFMQLYDLTTDLIGQNGRRGALMISISDHHPDLEDFIDIKASEGSITKANISIRASDDFMRAVEKEDKWLLHWEGEGGHTIAKLVDAREIFRKNAKNNWDWAEAGLLFWDRISGWHLMSEHPEHVFAGVNPCAEAPLMAGGSCLLGSLNLSEFVVHPFTDYAYFDKDKFIDAVLIAVKGLNDVLDEGLNLHPLEIQRKNAEKWRQIGLGVMGLADMFIKMGVSYGSEESLLIAQDIAFLLVNTAVLASSLLAKEKGAFPMYNDSVLESDFFKQNILPFVADVVKTYGLRNSQILSIAPTGSISTMWGVSGGIEPIFATQFERKTESLHGSEVSYTVYQPIVKQYLEATGKKEIPKDLIKTAHDIHWSDRLMMQAVWQKFIDSSISSTVNLPEETTVNDVENLFIEAWRLGLKGVTIFRDGCKRSGILRINTEEDPDNPQEEQSEAPTDFITCPECGEPIKVFAQGCSVCMNCGYSPC